MRNYFPCLLLMMIFFSCGTSAVKKEPPVETLSPAYLEVQKDSVLIPSFSVQVKLSPLASQKLAQDKETIIVHAWFSGIPKDSASKEYRESGALFIRQAQAVADSNGVAGFEGIRFAKAIYDSLADKDIRVLINVYSGRRSASDNLLDCGMLADKMSAVKGKKIVLEGKLINETDSLPK